MSKLVKNPGRKNSLTAQSWQTSGRGWLVSNTSDVFVQKLRLSDNHSNVLTMFQYRLQNVKRRNNGVSEPALEIHSSRENKFWSSEKIHTSKKKKFAKQTGLLVSAEVPHYKVSILHTVRQIHITYQYTPRGYLTSRQSHFAAISDIRSM